MQATRQQEFSKICRDAGWKCTSQRLAVYDFLADNLSHPDVDTVWAAVRSTQPAITRESVYRILNEFAAKGIIRRMDHIDSARYDSRTGAHGHFICEKCGRPMVIKSGRYGKFVACSGFPECRNAHPIVKDTGGLCPLCGGHMLLRKSAKGRVYYGCSNYPTCNFMTWDEPVPETCPHCGKTLFKRRGQLYCAKEGCGFVKNIEKTKAEK